jgi:signal peptidase I
MECETTQVTETGKNEEAKDLKEAKKKKKSAKRNLIEWILILGIAIGVAVLLRVFVVTTYYIPSSSMEPTLQIGDRILVDKLAFDFGSVKTGEIIVFHAPSDMQGEPPGTVIVKRVIGLPGQVISSNVSGQIFINGHLLKEPWLPANTAPGRQIEPPVKIPSNEYFVMGDNRADSEDSRYFGPIPASLIIGKVDAIVWHNGRPDFHWF